MTWLIGLPVLGSPLLYLAGRRSGRLFAGIRLQWLATAILVLLWCALAITAVQLDFSEPQTITIGAATLRMDGVSLLMTVLVVTLATCCVLFSGGDIVDEQGAEKYYATILVLTGALIGLVCAADLFNLWLWFEITAIASYMLIAYDRSRPDALLACVKYFVATTVGSMLVLFAIALVLAHAGTLDLAALRGGSSPLLIVAGALFLMGFGAKAALAPNFTWLPDTYASAPAAVSALLSGVVSISALIALMRVLGAVSASPEQWGAVLMLVGTINIVIGNLAALPQTQVRRILAYSSISHTGFILLALGTGIAMQSTAAMQSGMLHLLIHGLMKALAFLAVGVLAYSWRTGSNPSSGFAISDLKDAARHHPATALALTLALLSLAGVPPLAGFYSKLQILSAGVNTDSGWITLLTILAALNSALSFAYYLPIISALYKMTGEGDRTPVRLAPLTMRVPVFMLAASLVIFGMAPGLLTDLTGWAAQALLAMSGS